MNDYEKIIKEAEENDQILGLILVGSRGKEFENEYSDYDLVVIIKDGAAIDVSKKYTDNKIDNIDVKLYSLSDFKKYAAWDSPESWDRYNYEHVKILDDKTNGKLMEIIKEKGYIPEDKREKLINWWLDAYINGVYRSIKCIRNNNLVGAHLEAVNSILDLLTLVFAINGRHRPFLGYVQKELEKYPLESLPWEPLDFVKKIKNVLETANLKTQQELLIGIEKMSLKIGYGKVFDSWEGKDKWAMSYKRE